MIGSLVIEEAMEQFWRDGQAAFARQQAERFASMFADKPQPIPERQADQRWVEDTRALYEAQARPDVIASTNADFIDAWRRVAAMTDPHAFIVGRDGKVGAIDPSPMEWWRNRGA